LILKLLYEFATKLDLVFYFLIILAASLNFILFLSYKRKVGKVSFIFYCISFIFLGIVIQDTGTIAVAIAKHFSRYDLIREWTMSWWWTGRLVIKAAFMYIFFVHMFWRYRHMDKLGQVNYGRRRDD
jgi:hypothetical protein